MRIYRRENSAVYHVSFSVGGRRIRRSTGRKTKEEARTVALQWERELRDQLQLGRQPDRAFDEVLLAYLKANTSKKSAQTDRYNAIHLHDFFSGCLMRDIGAAQITAYVTHRTDAGNAPGTINRQLALFQTAINWCRTHLEWTLSDPVKGRFLKEPEGRVRWITREEADRLITAAEKGQAADHLPDFIRLALNTGCRRGELLGMDWSRVNLKEGLIHLEAQHTKGGKRRSVPLNSTAREAMLNRARHCARACPSSPWVFPSPKVEGQHIGDMKRAFASATKAVGITDFTIHDLRHTCASWLVMAGVPLYEVKELLGHSSITMTERYAHLAPQKVRDAVSKLDQIGEADQKNAAQNWHREASG